MTEVQQLHRENITTSEEVYLSEDSESTQNSGDLDYDVRVDILMPDNTVKKATIIASTPWGDLKAQLCSDLKLSPSEYVFDVISSSPSNLKQRRASAAIGKMNASMITIQPKSRTNKPAAPQAQISYKEATVRLIVRLARLRQSIIRVNPNAPLKNIFGTMCDKLNLKEEARNRLEFRHPTQSDVKLNLDLTLNDYSLREIYLAEKSENGLKKANSPNSDKVKRKAPKPPQLSTPSAAPPMSSVNESTYSKVKKKRAPTKQRAAPLPPTQPKENNNHPKKDGIIENHSQNPETSSTTSSKEATEGSSTTERLSSDEEDDVAKSVDNNKDDDKESQIKEDENNPCVENEENKSDLKKEEVVDCSTSQPVADVISVSEDNDVIITEENNTKSDVATSDDNDSVKSDESNLEDDPVRRNMVETNSEPNSDDAIETDDIAGSKEVESSVSKKDDVTDKEMFTFSEKKTKELIKITPEEEPREMPQNQLQTTEPQGESIANEVLIPEEYDLPPPPPALLDDSEVSLEAKDDGFDLRIAESFNIPDEAIPDRRSPEKKEDEPDLQEKVESVSRIDHDQAAAKEAASDVPTEEDETALEIEKLQDEIQRIKKKNSVAAQAKKKNEKIKEAQHNAWQPSSQSFTFVPNRKNKQVSHRDFEVAPVGGIELLNNGEIKGMREETKSEEVKLSSNAQKLRSTLPSYYKKFLGVQAFAAKDATK